MTATALNIAQEHDAKRKDERFETGFNKTRQTGIFAQRQVQQSMISQKKSSINQNQMTLDGVPVGEIKSVTVKTVNK